MIGNHDHKCRGYYCHKSLCWLGVVKDEGEDESENEIVADLSQLFVSHEDLEQYYEHLETLENPTHKDFDKMNYYVNLRKTEQTLKDKREQKLKKK